MAILHKAVEYCAELGVPVFFIPGYAYFIPPMEDMFRTAYEKAGRPEMYSPDMIRYTGDDSQPAMISTLLDYFEKNKPAANIVVGALYYETYPFFGVGATSEDCVNLGGTPRLYYQGVVVALSDYPLIGQELFGAAAEITGNPWDVGSLAGEDVGTFLVQIMVAVSGIIASFGSTLWTQLINL
jgi:hypothetical protein